MADSNKKYFYSPSFIGLGGTGANIIEAFIRDRKTIVPLLMTPGIKISCLAIDVAEGDLLKLENAYKELKEEMKNSNINPNQLTLTTYRVRFSDSRGLLDFINKYDTYLPKEEVTFPSAYRPWVISKLDIPAQAGGVGRIRSLSKAIYGLNYYVLHSIKFEQFMQQMVGATISPMVFLLYGMGGGSGGGMVLDFTRHLRQSLRDGFPIIGIGVLPFSGDDPLSRGASGYSSIIEHGWVMNRQVNELITSRLGKFYENPYAAFFTVPLEPAHSSGKNVTETHEIADKAIVEILSNCVHFDMSDLLTFVGTNNDFGHKWMNVISTISISYPVQDYIDLTKIYLDQAAAARAMRKERREIFYRSEGSQITGGGVKQLLDICRMELEDTYRKWLVSHDIFDSETFKEKVHNLEYDDNQIEAPFSMDLKAVISSIREQMDVIFQSVKTIGLGSEEGTQGANIQKITRELYDLTKSLPDDAIKFETSVSDAIKKLPESAAGTQGLTPRQAQLINDMKDIVGYIQDYVIALRDYHEIKQLCIKLKKSWSDSDHIPQRAKALDTINNAENELIQLFNFISEMHAPPTTAQKNLDALLVVCQNMNKVYSEQEKVATSLCHSTEDQLRYAEQLKSNLEEELSQSWFAFFFFPGKKKILQDKLMEIKQTIISLQAELDIKKAELQTIQSKKTIYEKITKKYEVNSAYRKSLLALINVNSSYTAKRSELSMDRGLYEWTGQLTEAEHLKIIQRILQGDEKALSRETILNEIVDKDQLTRSLVTVLRFFQGSASLGLSHDYKTDFLWLNIVTPPGIWNPELVKDAQAALSIYLNKDVEKSLFIKETPSDDPWTVRFILVASRVSPKDINAFREMKGSYDSRTPNEKQGSRSFLLEQNISINDEDPFTLDRQLIPPKS